MKSLCFWSNLLCNLHADDALVRNQAEFAVFFAQISLHYGNLLIDSSYFVATRRGWGPGRKKCRAVTRPLRLALVQLIVLVLLPG